MTGYSLLLAVILLVLSYVFWKVPLVSETAYDLLPVDVIGAGFVLLILVAAIQAYYNNGLVISWLFVFCPLFGATLNFVGVGLQSPTLGERLVLVVTLPLVGALLIGTLGYLFGTTIRQGVNGESVN